MTQDTDAQKPVQSRGPAGTPPSPPPPSDNANSFDPATAFSSSSGQSSASTPASPQNTEPQEQPDNGSIPPVPPSAGVSGRIKIFPLDAKRLLLGGGILLFLNFLVAGLLYIFYFSPKIAAGKYLISLKSPLSSLKLANRNVKQAMEKIFLIVTEESSIDTPSEPLETSGILPPEEIASGIHSRALGVSTVKNSGILHPFALSIAQNLNGFMTEAFGQTEGIAGITTASEDVLTSKARTLKNEVLNAEKAIDEASASLKTFTDAVSSQPKLPKEVKQGLTNSGKVYTLAGSYFAQARNIADYYGEISDSIITVNTKINSFKISLISAGNVLTGISPQKSTTLEMKQRLSQVQIFIDQAKQDIEEIRSISVKLRNIPKENLPLGIDAYHEHNQEVYDIVIDYFTAQTDVVQGFITATSFLMTKADKGDLIPADVGNYQMVIREGTADSGKADAAFISSLQNLTSEETALTLSFWQDNKVLTSGEEVEKIIVTFEGIVAKLTQDSKVPFLNRL